MSSTMRWRYGETNPVVLPVASATVIEIGDLVYFDSGTLKPASALTYGASYVWASVPADNAVSRLDPRTAGSVDTTTVGHTPKGLAVAHGTVFVASNTDHRLLQLAPKTGEPVGTPMRVPHNPFAVAAGAGHVWVTGTADSTLSRIDY